MEVGGSNVESSIVINKIFKALHAFSMFWTRKFSKIVTSLLLHLANTWKSYFNLILCIMHHLECISLFFVLFVVSNIIS